PKEFHERFDLALNFLTMSRLFLYFVSPDQPKQEILMALAVGTKAPDFSLATKTAEGPKQIKLSENFGKTNTLLLFFPMAFTGVCTTEMCSQSSELGNYSGMNATVYGISGDNPFAQEAWAKKENISVTLLSDYDHKVAKDRSSRFPPWKNRAWARSLGCQSVSASFSNRCCAIAMGKRYGGRMLKPWPIGTRRLRRTRRSRLWWRASFCRILPAFPWWWI